MVTQLWKEMVKICLYSSLSLSQKNKVKVSIKGVIKRKFCILLRYFELRWAEKWYENGKCSLMSVLSFRTIGHIYFSLTSTAGKGARQIQFFIAVHLMFNSFLKLRAGLILIAVLLPINGSLLKSRHCIIHQAGHYAFLYLF